jgi:hypothetical protein
LETDHRLTPRQPFEQTVQFERSLLFTGETIPSFEIGQALDICPGGLCLKTEAPLQPRETLRIYLPVQAVDIPLPVFSEVCWVTSHSNFYRVGLQFLR